MSEEDQHQRHHTSERNPALDGIRGLAILWVFAFHAEALLLGGALDPPSNWGHALAAKGFLGVQLFFVLSGFLLARPWMQAASDGSARPSPGAFLARRAGRILPAYWLHLAVLFGLILPLLRGSYLILGTEIGWTNLALHVPLLHFLHPGSSSSLGLNMALWSLSIEAQFYLLLPLLAPLFVGQRVLLSLPIAIALALLWKHLAPTLLLDWIYLTVPPSRLVFFDPVSGQAVAFPANMMRFFLERQLPGEFMAFALGMAGANLFNRLERVTTDAQRQWHGLLDAAALVSGVLATWALITLPVMAVLAGAGWRNLGMPLFLVSCSLLILAAARRTTLIDSLFANPILAGIGLVSYSLFLWHEPILRLVAAGWLTPEPCSQPLCQVMVAFTIALLVAILSYRFAERRILFRSGK
ncbi:hypothetical protein CKO25_04605 [Thiocapsa imhoffii]|uniref:Acyltransferase 3 domain-containing protein n=1 Tax=Thiocapsa imhoffii TaxID=382777 RepID=A0A9X0WFW2_9GAMM|nr:acyltransferase [Thiocapsa imhoffii]MBK1643949.1 hypothetical protein [Thiocapsa imhoffii]